MEVHVRKGNYLLDFGFKKGHQILTFDGKHTLKIMFKKTLKLDFFLKRHNFLIDFEYLRHFRNIFVNKQIMFVTNFHDSEDKCIQFTQGCHKYLDKPGKLHFWAKIPGKWHFFQGKERLKPGKPGKSIFSLLCTK